MLKKIGIVTQMNSCAINILVSFFHKFTERTFQVAVFHLEVSSFISKTKVS